MDRFSLTDAQWERMGPFCLGKPTDPGRSGGDNRLFAEAVLWMARIGSPWRNLPPLLGKPRKWPRAISRGTRRPSASTTG